MIKSRLRIISKGIFSGLLKKTVKVTVVCFLLSCITIPVALTNEIPQVFEQTSNSTLSAIVASSTRSKENQARDKYRHPLETLEFFGLRSNMTVVELWPGNGWYTEILAPFLAPKGQLIVTNLAPQISKGAKIFQEKLAANPAVFGKVKIAQISPPKELILASENSVDMVLTFRNLHNWISGGYAEKVYAEIYKALKLGGILGIEEHRAKLGVSLEESAKNGYLSEKAVIAALEKAGFKFLDKSEINANALDTKDYPGGVWTLPPVLSQGEKDKERYLSIGESDRMTLKFIKPFKHSN